MLFRSAFPEIRMVLYSAMLVAIMLFRPQGLLGSTEVSAVISRRLSKIGRRAKEEEV